MTDIMSLHCLFQTHSKTELMYLKNKQVWTRISVACFEQQSAFFIDGLDLLSVASKDDGHGRSVTASELRWLYRHRHMPDVKNNLTFWKNYKKLSQEDVFSLPLWQTYRPKKIYQ